MLKKFGKKITKKGLLIAGGIAIVLVAVIIAIAIVSSKGEGTKKKNFTPDSELARAMTYDQFTDADSSVDGTDYVKFGAFFLRDINNDGYAEKIKGTCKQVGKEDTLYMELNVLTNGYLENGVITINSDNFYLQTAIPKDSEVKDNVISNNTKQISLNQINNGTQKLLTGIVRTGDYSYDSQKFAAIGNDTTKMSKVNSITLTGTHVAADGTRTQINKTVEFNMDWYGTTKTEIPNYIGEKPNLSQVKDNTNVINEEKKQVVFDFNIGMQETNNQLILSKAHLEGTIPQLNGYDPVKVEVVDSTFTFTYDEATRVFQVEKLTELNENGTVSKQCYAGTYDGSRYNEFRVKVTYPIDAYNTTGADTVELKIPVTAYYEGYNNKNTEFTNPYRSNIANGTIVLTCSRPTGTVAKFDITVGKYISSPLWKYVVSKKNPLRIYNNISTENFNDTYIVKWYGSTGSDGQTDGMIMKETKNGEEQVSDQFINSDSSTESMENAITNVGIYFGDPVSLLGENGWIKVYDDETGNLLHEFTKSDWSKYTENSPYKYDVQVKHIRVVTSETKASKSIDVYHVKKLDDEYITQNYTREQFDDFKYIKSTLVGYVGENYINTDTHSANYEAPYSMANLSINKSTISTQETEKDMEISIEAAGNENANQEKWLNSSFLLKLPKDIIDVDVKSVESSKSSVKVMSYEVYEKNEEKFIKIITSNENANSFMLKVKCNITPDPRIATTTETIDLYASNENGVDYYSPVEDVYDVNDNLNTNENVNISIAGIGLISPNSLLTNQSAINFDDKESLAVAPQIAVVSKEKRSATINVEINNNYSSTISEVKILGRVPFEGNKYTINGEEMGSTFTATMTNEGIQLPEALKNVAKVYYSTNGEATQDLTNAQNGWTQTPSDYSNVKSYLIDLGNYQLTKGEKHTISYNINIPAGLSYNKVAYSHHAVYFSLDTMEGKYRTQTEPNKIGFMIAKQYDLELTKFQKGKTKVISGATYAIYEEGNEEAKTKVTNTDGKLKLTGLYVDKTYVVKEVKSPNDYDLNEEVVKFTTSESDGKLSVTKNEGTVKNINLIQATDNNEYTVQIEVEDEANAKLKIIKMEKNSTNRIAKIGYKLVGMNMPEAGRYLTTNENGEIILSGLKIGEEYTLEEIKADGYYLANDKIKFTLLNMDGTYNINISAGEVKASNVVEENDIPVINLQLEDEKIPTYNLEISKIQRITSTALSEDELKAKAEQALASEETIYIPDACFKLYKDGKELGNYKTDSEGKIFINDLYQYIDGKNEEAIYLLKEVIAPSGYATVPDIYFKVDGSAGELNFINVDGKLESYTVSGNTVKLLVEDSPSFKLIKKDADTQEYIANVKFAIYNVDNGIEPARNSKGEIIGNKEIINDKEYYTVTTNSQGEIVEDLPQGLYKAIELQAPDKYDLSNSEYYFGIGASREGRKGDYQANTVCKARNYECAVGTLENENYIFGDSFEDEITLNDGTKLTSNAYIDIYIVKYDSEGNIIFAKNIGGDDNEYINSIMSVKDGGFIISFRSYSSQIDFGNNIVVENAAYGYEDAFIAKYDENGECEWADNIGGYGNDWASGTVATSDGGCVISGSFFSSQINLKNGMTLNKNTSRQYADGFLVKYNKDGEIEWGKQLDYYIKKLDKMSDDDIIAVGYASGSDKIKIDDNTTLDAIGGDDGIVIKFSNTGEVKWTHLVGDTAADMMESVKATSDGGALVGGSFWTQVVIGNRTYYSNGQTDAIIIKYDKDGEVEWVKVFGGRYDEDIYTIEETSSGEYIIGGEFCSPFISLENGWSLSQIEGTDFNGDGMIMKYDKNGNLKYVAALVGESYEEIDDIIEISPEHYIISGRFGSQESKLGNTVFKNIKSKAVLDIARADCITPVVNDAESIGNTSNTIINDVNSTSDGGYIVGGRFTDFAELKNGETLKTNGKSDGLLIKYDNKGNIEWNKNIGGVNYDEIKSVKQTKDKGYIVVGSFEEKIDLGNNIELESCGSEDGMILKYNHDGAIEWARRIGGSNTENINSVSECSDNGYIVGGYTYSANIELENGISINFDSNDGFLIKYDECGEVEWAKKIGGTDGDTIEKVIGTTNGEILAVGKFYSKSIELDNGITLRNGSYTNNCDGMIIKYSNNGTILWAKVISGPYADNLYSITECADGGYLIVGSFESFLYLENNINLNSSEYSDGLILKCSQGGNVEWAQSIGGDFYDILNSVIETADGGYLVGGSYRSSKISLDNNIELTGNRYYNGMVLKYSSNGKVQWAKGVGGDDTDEFNSIALLTSGDVIAVGVYTSENFEVDNEFLYRQGLKDGMILKISEQEKVNEVRELVIENQVKKFKITTDVKEIDNEKGGSISGEDRDPYEIVKYGDSSSNEIKMVPKENYEIIEITVNGKEYKYTANEDGSYTMPMFTNMTEDKHVVVTYSLKNNKIIINKVDKDTKDKLAGAEFQLDQIEERSEPTAALGKLTDNGQEYTGVVATDEVTGKLGELTNNGTYYFVQNSDGTYTPTNSKTYQTANGGTAGIHNTTANSYVPIDLTGLTGTYAVVINASCSSESSDYGYAIITETTSAPSYGTVTGRFVYVSGTSSSKDYMSAVLDGGKKYYLHLGYRKDVSIDTNADQVVINSIKVYTAINSKITYNFTKNNGKYESTNGGKDSTVANSYIPIDLTNETGKYNLTVNAEISSERSDYGYVAVTGNTTRPSYYNSKGRFIYISGTQSAKDYTTVLQGGKMYYLHLGYYKDSSISSGSDKFIVNSVNISLNDSEIYHTTVETNSDGQAMTQIPFGKYSITETKAPEGYILNSTPTIVEFRSTDGAVHEFTIEDEAKAKLIVHHYMKGTTTKLVDDENAEAHSGDAYTTNPRLDLDKYELEKDSNGAFVLPANAVGKYKTGTTEVTYYYVEKQIPLTVHHYVEETTDKVPLKNGGTADDVTGSGKEGESYTTSAIANDKLSDEYELVETPSNANGTYSGNEVVVTYYYKKVARDVNLVKYKEDGKTPLAGAKFEINGVEYTTDENGKIKANLEVGTYDVTEIGAPDGYKLPANPTTKVTITKATPETINITNEKKTGTVTVHHYIQGTTTKVPLADGSTAADEVKTGNVGDMYATKSVDNLSERYELVSEPSNGSGTYIDGNIEVIYYYKTIPTSVLVHYYLEGTTTKLADDVTFDGIVGDNYTTGVAPVDSKYEVVAIPANANGKMTREQIVVIYYYRIKDTLVLVHHYKEGTSESLSKDVTITGKVDDAYTTSVASDIPSKYELVATPTNASGKMTVTQTVITYYYRLKSTGVDVHYYKEGTTEKVSKDVAIEGKVDQAYTTSPATDVESKYELVGTPANATGTMTEDRITVIYYYRLKDTSVLVHHYLEGTTTKLADDVTINGQVDDTYKTVVATDLLAGKYELVAEPVNKSGTMTEAQIIVIYYYRVKDTSVLVHHYIKGTTTSLSADVTINGKIDDKYTTTIADDIPEQYELVAEPTNKLGTMTEAQIVVTYYYQLKNYPYTVNYLEKGTNKVLHDAKQGGALVYGSTVKSSDEKIDIDGYNYDSVDKETLTIGTTGNVINIYYTKRIDLSYKVNYLEKGTNKVLHDQKVQNGMTFESTVTSANEVIDIDGYNYDSVDKATLKITTGENVINIYYTKRNDLLYKVNYLEKDTNKVLHDKKTQDGMMFGTVITSSDEIIDIDGYDYNSVDKNSIAIGTSENVINIYYTKRTDLSYKVNYLEKDTNKVLHDQKVQGEMTFESVVDSSKEVIDIDGYNYDSVDKATLTITTGENVINIYYTKRKDLSYKVNYLEKTTNKVLHDQKVQDGMTFESTVTSANEVIDIDGYNYDSVDKDTLTITTGENVINIYYTKKTDLSYRVNYLEKGTNKVLHNPKTQDGMTFESVVTSADEVIDIDGYNYDSVDKATLTITTGENVINIYYTKRNDLSYIVNYLEKDSDKVLHEPKTTENMIFESVINSSNEVIDIDGYGYDSVDKDKLVIGTGENVINIYYTKRTDLSYKVNYLEKGTNKVLHDQKVQGGMTFESTVTSSNEVIDINGYNYDSVDKDTLTIITKENVINIYYTKRTDLSYKVNYLEKDTNKVLHDPKIQEGMTFESNVNSADEVIDIYGYNYDSVDKDILTITTGENVINIYYTKKDTKVTVHYYEEGTTNKVSEDVEIPGKVFDNYETESASDIPSKYELVAEPENKNGTMTEDEITVIYYYRKKATQVIVHYYEENTTKKLSEDVTINGRVDDKYTTISATDIPIKYELVAEPVNKSGNMTEATIEVIYYYRVKDAVVHVRYLEKGTDIVLADPDRIDGKVDEDYQTMQKEIDGYQLVEHTGNEKGKFEVEPLTITYYYLYKTKATVQYIDKITGQILEQSTTEGLEGDDFVTESKDFENYVLVEEPPEKTVKMTKEEQVLKYYYIHISGGVIEKHIDIISNEILANDAYEGNEGDEYDIPSKTFDGYDLVEDRLPSNAKGIMKVEPVEVIYYYIYRSKVTAEYIDKNTGEKLTDDVTQNGHEGDNYITDRKTFDDYKLVEVPANADGSMTKEDIIVTYYYVHTSGGVIVNHIDIKTGKQLLDETKEEGYEGDPYETHEENIPEYDLVKEKYPENAVGKMTIEPTRVTYYYIKKTEVNVKYVDKETGEEIDESTNIPGHEGDDYTTEPKDVPEYDLIEEPENKDGTMTADPIDVIYYYKRPAKVIVNYYDIDTKEKLADEIEITGHQNDDYTTEQKDIKYYEIAKVPENKDGKMVVTVTKDENGKEIVEDTTYVNYYYRKLIFNLKVDKTIVSVIVNGQETGINGTLGKVEVHRKNISTANVKVVYKIKVTNDSELSGKANVVENMPSGMTMLSKNNPDWTIKETTASLETDEIKPGESREYQVVLGWQNGDNNVGTKTNMVSITTENEANFDEQFETDNVSKADLIVAVGTGEVPYAKIAGGILLIMISITAGVYVISKKRQ